VNLTPEQTERVRYLVEDRWGGDTPSKSWEDFERVLARMSAEELHEFAEKMNWDGGGADRLMRVLAHPRCDRGTALMISWRTNPVYHASKYGDRDGVKSKMPSALAEWDMMRYIEQRLAAPGSFAAARIPFDPRNDFGRDRTNPKVKKRMRPVLEKRDGKFVKVGEELWVSHVPIDAHKVLPPVVFEPVKGG
jgi:hypothetical protein